MKPMLYIKRATKSMVRPCKGKMSSFYKYCDTDEADVVYQAGYQVYG